MAVENFVNRCFLLRLKFHSILNDSIDTYKHQLYIPPGQPCGALQQQQLYSATCADDVHCSFNCPTRRCSCLSNNKTPFVLSEGEYVFCFWYRPTDKFVYFHCNYY